jgi:chromate transporter
VLLQKELAGSFEWISAFIGLAAFISLFRYKVPAIPAVGACAAVALVLTLSKRI